MSLYNWKDFNTPYILNLFLNNYTIIIVTIGFILVGFGGGGGGDAVRIGILVKFTFDSFVLLFHCL